MQENLLSTNELAAIAGIKLGVAASGSKYKDRDDIAIFEIAAGSSVAAVFTKNLFCAAPVVVAKKSLSECIPKYLLINAGNANAGTGEQGLQNAQILCQSLASAANCNSTEVLPFSTGVIGEQLAVDVLSKTIPMAYENRREDGWQEAAAAILTTDLVSKTASILVNINGKPVSITGMTKGSGMICPNMATMLAYVATDACIDASLLQTALQQATDNSFNCITVDGDTSTNDACILIATQQASNNVIRDLNSGSGKQFMDSLNKVFQSLAQQIIRDGEGATKFITINITGAASDDDANTVAYTVAHSPLVKTAMFASDPNWGRILAAIGRADIETLDIDSVSISLGDVAIITNGLPAESYTEEQGSTVMKQEDIDVNITLGTGNGSATLWTTDLTYDYVKINAEYRS